MSAHRVIEGVAAPLPINNLDTDQIMPKQFLRGIDKAGMAQGVLYDLRFDEQGALRSQFVLNRPEYRAACILVGGENFGCGSSREHAVWGLVQYGIRVVVAPSFGEIFYSNAMNNRLLLATVSPDKVERLVADVGNPETNVMVIDIHELSVRSAHCSATIALSPRYHRMFIEGMDQVETSLAHREAIEVFESRHWAQQPWLKSVPAVTVGRRSAAKGELGVS